ncbi:MAG: ATP12 family protein [Pseudomonadota bacterium]|nr:ATP12 family protein [Pseudomonadota bacterium]
MLIRKEGNYFHFETSRGILKTNLNNKITVKEKLIATNLSKYLELCLISKKKEKIFFMQILNFCYDLNKENKLIFIEKMIGFLDTDLLCYRADLNTKLELIQKKKWDPLIDFVANNYGLSFKVSNSVMPNNHSNKNNEILLSILEGLKKEDFTVYYFITNFTNSNIIALNFLANNIKFKDAWDFITIEEDYSFSKWGIDKEAMRKLEDKEKYFQEIIKFSFFFNNQETEK